MSPPRTKPIRQFGCPACGYSHLIVRDELSAITVVDGALVKSVEGFGVQCPMCAGAFAMTPNGFEKIGNRVPKPNIDQTREEVAQQKARGVAQRHPLPDDVTFGESEPE